MPSMATPFTDLPVTPALPTLWPMIPKPDVATPCTPTPPSHWPTTPVPEIKVPCSSMIKPSKALPMTPKELVMPMTPVSPKNRLEPALAVPRTPIPSEVVGPMPMTPARVMPAVTGVEKLSPRITALHEGAPRRCTQNAVCWVPNALPLWTSSVPESARLNGG
jgi:hypothetical protein